MKVNIKNNIQVIWSMALKDIQSSFTERAFMITSIIIPINFLLLFLLFALTGGQAPIAIVTGGNGPYSQQFILAMANSHSFIIQETSAVQALNLMRQGQIVAIVTIPSNFEEAIQKHQKIQLPVVINNLDTDFTNDIRRAVPLAITSFYANAFPDQVVVKAQETDTYSHDTGYVQYLVVSLMVVSVMLGGLLQGGSNAAREYEKGTIKELMLAPVSIWAIQIGKVLGALILNSLAVAVIFVVIVFFIGVWPIHWDELLVICFYTHGNVCSFRFAYWYPFSPKTGCNTVKHWPGNSTLFFKWCFWPCNLGRSYYCNYNSISAGVLWNCHLSPCFP